MTEIKLTIDELQHLLNEQKKTTAAYISRNLSVYSDLKHTDIDKTKEELRTEALNSGYPDDFNVLKRYIK